MKKIISGVYRVAKTDFVKVSAWSAVSTIIKMITGFVSVKVVAKIIGPPGMALVGQFLNAITMLSTLGTGCINMGITKYIAEHQEEPLEQKKVIANSLRITIFSTMLVSTLVIVFSRPLGNYIFRTTEYTSLIIIFGFSLILYSFNMLMVSIINGFKHYKKYVLVNVISSVAALALSIVLVTQFGLFGALLNCVASQSVIIVVTLIYVYREPWFRSLFSSIKVDWGILRKLGKFTIMVMVSALLVPLSQFAVRSYITDHISLNEAGLWEAMNRLSSMYLLVITTSISTFYLPRLSEIKDQGLLRQEILKTAKIVLPILAVGCLAVFVCRDIIIRLLFSKEFLPMRDLFAFQLIGDFLKISSWLVAFLFWAKAMTKEFIITEIIANVAFILLARLAVDRFGLEGSVYAYALNYLVYLFIILFIFRKLLFQKAKS